jgi:hypothetical protein
MKKFGLYTIFLLGAVLFYGFSGCTNSTETSRRDSVRENQQLDDSSDTITIAQSAMSNPVLLANGTDIGTLFTAYYNVGSLEKMVPLLDEKTRKKYSTIELEQLLSKLNLGFKLKLTGMKNTAGFKLLSYTGTIDATKVTKRLHVVIENDTARIVPSDLVNGEIFQ